MPTLAPFGAKMGHPIGGFAWSSLALRENTGFFPFDFAQGQNDGIICICAI
jgi:hypothetical protein